MTRRYLLLLGAIIFSVLVGFIAVSYFINRTWLFENFTPVMVVPLFALAIACILFTGLFIAAILDWSPLEFIHTGLVYGLIIGLFSLLFQFVLIFSSILKMNLRMDLSNIDNASIDSYINIFSSYMLIYSSLELVSWILFIVFSSFMAVNAIMFVSKINAENIGNYLYGSDWRSSIVGFLIFSLLLFGSIETWSDLREIIEYVFIDQLAPFDEKVVLLIFAFSLVSLLLFALIVSLDYLFNFGRTQNLIHKIGMITCILSFAFLLFIGVNSIFNDLIIDQVIYILLLSFIDIFLLWLPRPFLTIIKKDHYRRWFRFSLLFRIIVVPLLAYLASRFITSIRLVSTTWLMVAFIIVGYYYFQIGIVWLLSQNHKIKKWMSQKVNSRVSTNLISEKKIILNKQQSITQRILAYGKNLVRQVTKQQSPTFKAFAFGFGTWIFSKLVDSIFDWVVQEKILQKLFIK